MTDRPTDRPLNGRIALVTGATRGIGRALALGLAQAGAQVVATGRTTGALEELDDEIRAIGGQATLIPLNLKDGAAIDRMGGALYERFGRVDILIGNAGVLGELTPLSHAEPKMWDEVMAVNVTANWRLIRSIEPLLKMSEAGRAMFMTSGVARVPRAYWGPYAVSKAAVECMVATWVRELTTTRITANLVSPGPMRTKMREIAMPGEDPMTLPEPAELVPHVVMMARADFTTTGHIFDFRSKTLKPMVD